MRSLSLTCQAEGLGAGQRCDRPHPPEGAVRQGGGCAVRQLRRSRSVDAALVPLDFEQQPQPKPEDCAQAECCDELCAKRVWRMITKKLEKARQIISGRSACVHRGEATGDICRYDSRRALGCVMNCVRSVFGGRFLESLKKPDR